MLHQNILFALAAAGIVSSLPLNINLGAYSPALVVGDGEISFGGAQSAGELMETLASGAAVAGNAGGQIVPGQQQEGQQQAGQQQAGGERQAAPVPIVAGQPNTNAANVEGEADNSQLISGMISNGLDPSIKRPNVKSKIIAPNMVKRSQAPVEKRNPAESVEEIIKRELNGFREALNFARLAQQTSPKVELGTGAEGAGVGVIVNPGSQVAANSAANGARPAGQVAKRYVAPGAEMGAAPELPKSGITLMAIAEI